MGNLTTNQSFESESQVVLDVLAPSSQPGGTETIIGSFVDSTIAPPNLPDSTKRDGNEKRFDFLNINNPMIIKEYNEDDEAPTEEKADTLVTVRPTKFQMTNDN